MGNLQEAQFARIDAQIDALVDTFIESKLKSANLAAPISPHAKVKLRFILKKYAAEDHPFRACTKDLMPHFGPGRTEATCAVLKDTIVGNKKWRHGGGHKLAESETSLDGEVLLALDAISPINLSEIFLEARALDEHGTVEGVALMDVTGIDELRRWGCDGEIGLAIAAKRSEGAD